MWLQVELSQPATIAEIQFESTAAAVEEGPAVRGAPTRTGIGPGGPPAGAAPGFPRGYQVQLSMDGVAWGSPVAEGQGSGAQTLISFQPARAKFVRITQTASTENAPPLSIRRLRFFAPGTLNRDTQH